MTNISNLGKTREAVTAYVEKNSIDFSKGVPVLIIQEGTGEIGDLQTINSTEELVNVITSPSKKFKRCMLLIDDDPLSIFIVFTENEDKELFSVMKSVASNN